MGSADDFEKKMKEALENGTSFPDFPSDLTPLDGLAAAAAEQFKSFNNQEEFSRREAIYLTAAVITNNPGTAPPY